MSTVLCGFGGDGHEEESLLEFISYFLILIIEWIFISKIDMLSQVSSAPPPFESPFFGWTCLEYPCGGGGAYNAERGGNSGVANAQRDGGERR